MVDLQEFEVELAQLNIDTARLDHIDYVKEFCATVIFCTNQYFNIDYSLAFEMPAGYENAFGLTRDDKKTIYLNLSKLPEQSVYDLIFYFFHELRHSVQYSNASLFSPAVAQNLKYIAQYDGTIFYERNGIWEQYKMEGTEDYLTEFYLASPCEIDANEFAVRIVNRLFPARSFDHIRKLWFPQYTHFDKNEFERQFAEVVAKIEGTYKI